MGSFFKKNPNPYSIAAKLSLVAFLLQVIYRYELHTTTVEVVLLNVFQAHLIFALLTLLVDVICSDLHSERVTKFQQMIWWRFLLVCITSISTIIAASIYCSSSTVECVEAIVTTHHTITLNEYRVVFPRLDLASAVTGIILSITLIIYSCHAWYKQFFGYSSDIRKDARKLLSQ